jgi:CHASE2 domain-containing sensor protein
MLFFLSSYLIDLLEPFGIGNATKAHSGQISARLMAPFYWSKAHDKIAVVLIDQQTLDVRGQAWPPRYDYYENVLRRVLRQGPHSIYFDILTTDLRPYDDSLQDARDALGAELADAGVPLWLGVISPYSRSVFSGVPGVATAVAGWQGVGADYPLILRAENFILENQPAQSPGNRVDHAESVALTLYREACLQEGSVCSPEVAPLKLTQADEPMTLFWGWERAHVPAALQPRLGACFRETGASTGVWARLSRSVTGAVNDFFSGLDPRRLDEHRERCPPILTLLEHQLDDPAVAALLADRVVLIGTRLAALDDSVVSPVHQRMPGVYMHAMALDNLMTWGERRLHRNEALLKGVAWVSALLLSIALAWTFRYIGGCARRATLLIISCAILLGSTVALQVFLRQPPLDWIGTMALMFTILFYQRHRPGQAAGEA